MSRRGLALVLGVALAAFFYFAVYRHYPTLLASAAGLAAGVLAFMVRRTLGTLTALYVEPGSSRTDSDVDLADVDLEDR